jgi:MFS transporter
MSTFTQTQPDTAVPPRLLSAPLAVTFGAEFTSLTSFFLLLSVMPMLAAAAGAGSSGAGLITGSLLLGTVAAEAAASASISRFGYRMVLAAGAVLLGAPALAMLASEPPAVMIGVSVLRGFGFGLCGVATGALTAKLLPPGRRGEGLGLLGLVAGVPAIVALPAGIWLAGHHLAAARRRPGRLRPDLRPHRLPGGIRPYRRGDPRRTPGRAAGAESRGPRGQTAATWEAHRVIRSSANEKGAVPTPDLLPRAKHVCHEALACRCSSSMRLPSGSATNAIRTPGSGDGPGGITGRAPRATARSYPASRSATSNATCPYPSRSAACAGFPGLPSATEPGRCSSSSR